MTGVVVEGADRLLAEALVHIELASSAIAARMVEFDDRQPAYHIAEAPLPRPGIADLLNSRRPVRRAEIATTGERHDIDLMRRQPGTLQQPFDRQPRRVVKILDAGGSLLLERAHRAVRQQQH